MAIKDVHYDKYKSNRELLKVDVFELDSSEHLDWAITIAFYGALHLVEKKLYEVSSKHSNNHQDRKMNILTTKELQPISSQYHALYIQSMRARYDCCSFTKQDASKALQLLNEIEKTVS